jgi:hypothetical protein
VLYRHLADVVLVIHALIVAFIFFGLTGAAIEPWIGLFHFPLALWACIGGIMGWICPLTPLENRLRRAAGEQGYEGSCVDYYIGRRFGLNPGGNDAIVPNNKGRKTQIIVSVLIGVLSLAVYGTSWSMYRDAIWPPSTPPAAGNTMATPR